MMPSGVEHPSFEVCVIFNPVAGRGRAARRLSRLRKHWQGRTEFRPTRHAGHAEELAYEAARAGFAVVTAAGGDGTVHEVANGLLRAGRPDVIFGVAPLGSANDYAYSLRHDPGPDPTGGRLVDVGLVRSETGRQRYFVCCLGLGLNGAVTVESRRIKRLRGLALYGLATLRALWYHYACPVMHLTLDDEKTSAAMLSLSVLVGQREGNFVMAPDAQLGDGWFEFVQAGALSRWEVLRYLPRLALGGPPRDHPQVRLGRCRTLHVRSEAPLPVHIDGELLSQPQDNVRNLDIRLLPAALRVQLFEIPE
jgi:diacylglycerol kinase family enzyme